MKILMFLILAGCFNPCIAQQQNFIGIWEGKINLGASLRIVFEFSENKNGGLTGILKSPDQSPAPISADTTYAKGDSIFTGVKKFGIAFKGILINDSTITGSFIQGVAIPLQLKKVLKASVVKRPQTPIPPFSYYSEDISYYNADRSIKFGGTITYPKIEPGTNYIKAPTYPAVLLITGSSPQDRDETIFMHKPFAVIADELTRKGFVVLRADDRGVGKTTGNYATATTADFAKDAEAGIAYLKTLSNVDTAALGLIGHSEGAMIAPMIAARRNDIKFIVMLAGPGVPVKQLMYEQGVAVSMAQGESPMISKAAADLSAKFTPLILANTNNAVFTKRAISLLEKEAKKDPDFFAKIKLATPAIRKQYASQITGQVNTPWNRYFYGYDPKHNLKKLQGSVLALNGEKDIQVLSKSNLAGIRAALQKSKVKNFEVIEIPGLNHLFQTCKTCSVAEYGELEESFSPVALKIISDWLWKQYINPPGILQ